MAITKGSPKQIDRWGDNEAIMSNHPKRHKGYGKVRLYYLAYRSAITGTVTTAEYESERERDERLAALKADPTIEWAAARAEAADNYW